MTWMGVFLSRAIGTQGAQGSNIEKWGVGGGSGHRDNPWAFIYLTPVTLPTGRGLRLDHEYLEVIIG